MSNYGNLFKKANQQIKGKKINFTVDRDHINKK